jgi:hypothetical protein
MPFQSAALRGSWPETSLWEVNDQIPKRIVAKPEAIQCGPSKLTHYHTVI